MKQKFNQEMCLIFIQFFNAVIEANTKKRSQRLGKDEKLAKEAGITFNVKVSTSICFLIYVCFLADPDWLAHG